MLDVRDDQAAGLRRLAGARPVKVLAVSGGKGGVGKSSVAVNLAVALAAREREVMLLDADLGLANLDVLLGLQPRWNLQHLLEGQCALADIIVTGPGGVRLVPAASGSAMMAALDLRQQAAVVQAFSELTIPVDALVVDTAAGLSPQVLTFLGAAHELLVVVCDEPASITDAYGTIKVLKRRHGLTRFRVVTNMTAGPAEGRRLFEKLARVAERFLDVTLVHAGNVPEDPHLRRAVQQQRAVVEAYPSAPSSLAFRRLAAAADGWPAATRARGNLEFFVERLIGVRHGHGEAVQ